jgi:glycosyltransferase involved in cell wall biosynthesis
MTAAHVAVVVSGFPRTSETFALNELTALARRGMLAGIFATKRGDSFDPQPGCHNLLALVDVLPAGTAAEQGAVIAVRLANRRVTGIHAYFAHTPAEVAEHAALRLEVPFGFSVHAKDARKVESTALLARAGRAACVVACNSDVARDLDGRGARIHLVPHGVDRSCFQPSPLAPREGRALRLLAVGRLVEKKGFDILLRALARVDAATLRIVGDGPERDRLIDLVMAEGLGGRVAFAGSCTHRELPAEYADADVVVVPSVVDSCGDRDGLPNVVLEAMASGRPVIATAVGAIAAAVQDGATGLLVAEKSPEALSEALNQLAANPELRRSMGRRAAARAADRYDLEQCVNRFSSLMEAAYA